MRKRTAAIIVVALVLAVAMPAYAKPHADKGNSAKGGNGHKNSATIQSQAAPKSLAESEDTTESSSASSAENKAAAKAAKAAGKKMTKPLFISHPFVSKSRIAVGTEFEAWGFVWPMIADTESAQITLVVQKWEGFGKWTEMSEADTEGTLSDGSGKFTKKSNYSATMSLDEVGRYRIRAKLVWTDAEGVSHAMQSSWKHVRAVADAGEAEVEDPAESPAED